jgi:monoamine oxidase
VPRHDDRIQERGAQMTADGGGGKRQISRRRFVASQRLVLGSPVRRIEQGAGGVTVVSDRATVKARQVIVAIAPALAGRIDYQPILPFERDQLTQRFGQGTLTKVAAVYDRPFWRDQGLTGTAVATAGEVLAKL